MPGQLLPVLAGAIVFLTALALAGIIAATGLAARWHTAAAAMVTITLPAPDAVRLRAVDAVLASSPSVSSFLIVPAAEEAALLTPWPGQSLETLGVQLPVMIDVSLAPGAEDSALLARVRGAAAGAVVQRPAEWLARLNDLIRSLRGCAALVLAVVALVSIAIVAASTSATLEAGRDAVAVIHGLSATDGLVAGQFARRVTVIVDVGAILGVAAVLPGLLGLASLAAPFRTTPGRNPAADMPPVLWLAMAALPIAAASIAWTAAQLTVRTWLRRLP